MKYNRKKSGKIKNIIYININKGVFMKKFAIISTVSLFFSIQAFACPYSSMAKIESQLETSENLSKAQVVKILKLKNEALIALNSGKVEESEVILDKALALFN
ncbi:MAG: hypothetical protein CMM91_08520 [Rickettsiales bacterium]|nr:hypothetical protein [Rickettsiales bacterium]